jgi:PAS domain S-box-containing protein
MQTENRLLRSEQEFRAIAENVPGLFSYIDRNSRYRFVNKRYKEWFGLLRSEIIGRHYRSIVGEAAYELVKHYVEKVLSGHRVHYEERLPYAKGGTRWVSAEYIPDADERGKVKGFFAFVTDITERKTAEEILRESEARYRAVVEQSADGIFLDDVSTRTLIEANPAFQQLLGYSQEEIGHLSIYDIVAAEPMDVDRRFHDILQLEKGPPFTHERRYRRKDGSLLDVWLSSQVISYGGKQVVCTLVRDLTDRKRAEEALRASEEKFRTLFESSRDAIYINTPENRFLDINQAGLELFGYSKEEILRLNVREVYANPDDRAQFQGEMDKEGFVKDREIKLRDKNGKAMHCMVTAILRRTADGRPLEYQGIIRDVGDFKRTEDQLRRSREQLRALSSRMERIREEERTRISREIHDELGQQLTGLRMDLSWLTRRLGTHEGPLIERSKAMLGLIDAIIQTVRKISTELRPGILDDLGLAAAAEWQALDFEKRTGISCEFRSTLGESDLDPGLCTAAFRILQEALTNVARHADAPKVRVGLRKKGDNLIVEVTDNGRGITEEEITHARSLGLLGMRERALAFGGNLKITSAPNKGTRLILSLPLVKEES